MAYLNFTNALMEAKRRAQLTGRPISQQEVEGIASGFASSAAEKNIQEMGLAESKRQFTETLTQRKYETEKELEAAEEAKKEQKMRGMASGVGTIVGGVAGGVMGAAGTYGFGTAAGAAGGAALGSQVGGVMYDIDPLKGTAKSWFGNCIIITSCTSPESYEVYIARQYRDRFMSEEVLTGYYSLCIFVAPLIQKFKRFRQLTKKILVDRLVDYGECCLGYKKKRKYLTSGMVKTSFLGLCWIIGKGANTFLEVRNG